VRSTSAFAEAHAIASARLIVKRKGDDVDPHEIGSKWVFDDMWGFTADVSQPVLLEFFKALIVCANADGEITDAEHAWCIGYCAATGATPETLAELQEYDGAEDILEVIERGRHLGTAHRPVILRLDPGLQRGWRTERSRARDDPQDRGSGRRQRRGVRRVRAHLRRGSGPAREAHQGRLSDRDAVLIERGAACGW
jgi:hypothetical protein